MLDLIQNLCIVCLNACLFDISINVANPCLNKNPKCLLEACVLFGWEFKSEAVLLIRSLA